MCSVSDRWNESRYEGVIIVESHHHVRVLRGKRILLGVTGGIAAYKAVTVASRLTQAGAEVDVLMTDAAQKFVAPLSFLRAHRPAGDHRPVVAGQRSDHARGPGARG